MDAPLVTKTLNESMKTALERLMKTATPEGKLTQYIGLKNGCFAAKNIGLTMWQSIIYRFLTCLFVCPGRVYYNSIKQCVMNDEAAAKAKASKSLSGQKIEPYFGEATAPGYNQTMAAVRKYAESKLSLKFDRSHELDGAQNGYFMVNVKPSNASKTAGKAAVAAAAVTTTAPASKAVLEPKAAQKKFRADYKAASADEKIEMLEARIKGKLEGDKLKTEAEKTDCFTILVKKYSEVLADPECNKTGKDCPVLTQLANLCSMEVQDMFNKAALFNELNRIKNPDARLNRLEQIASANIRNAKSMRGALKALVIDEPHYYAAALANPKCRQTIDDCPILKQMLEGGGNLAVSLSAYESLVEQLQNNIVSVDTKSEEKVFSYLEKLNNIIPLMYSDLGTREIADPQKVLLARLISRTEIMQKSLQGTLNAFTEEFMAIQPDVLTLSGASTGSPTTVHDFRVEGGDLLASTGLPPPMVGALA